MSVFSIEWHKIGQFNFRRFIDEEIKDLESLRNKIEQDEKNYTFRQKQIEEAIKQGKDGFDAEKFLIKLRSCYND